MVILYIKACEQELIRRSCGAVHAIRKCVGVGNIPADSGDESIKVGRTRESRRGLQSDEFLRSAVENVMTNR